MGEMKKLFGQVEGRDVYLYTIANSSGMNAELSQYGAAIVSISAKDGDGLLTDVVAGPADLDGFVHNASFFGVVIGRYANRIAGAKFALNGKEYPLARNDGDNHLHGGPKGYHSVVWDVKEAGENSVTFAYHSPDGEEGYPGDLDVSVKYTLTEDNALQLEYFANGSADTPVNLTNHVYINLDGHNAGYIGDIKLQLFADRFIPTDSGSIPLGVFQSVKDTPFDFTAPAAIGARIDGNDEQLVYGSGYDQCFALSGEIIGQYYDKPVRAGARAEAAQSGIIMAVETSEPGLQLYSGNHMKGTGKQGTVYGRREAFCLEAGCFPNAVNEKNFPSPVLEAGREYRQLTRYIFSVR